VLGTKIGILLVVTVCLSGLISESYAESILVEFDKSEYKTGDKLIISGSIVEFSMPIVAMSIYDPNDKILSANNLELDSEGKFSKTFFLDSPFYDISGNYKVKINYKKISQDEFFTIDGKAPQPDPILEPIIPEIVLLATEKEVYTDGDTIEITGIVSVMDSPTALIGIYDPFGTPAGFYFGTVDDSLFFSTSFLAKEGVNFKIDGVYTVKAHYAESELTTNFEFYQTNPSLDDTKPSDNTKPTIPKNSPTPIIENNTNDQSDTKQNDDSINKSTNPETSTKKDPPKIESTEDNLSVEDIELGKLLNQINLECDRSKYSDTISYYDGMGPALYRLCKFESSIQFFDESLSKDPQNIEALVNKGSALRKLGYSNDAINYFEKALKIDSNFVPAINNKANVFASLGKYDEAVALYAEALGKNPGYSTARQNMELVLSEMPQNIPPTQKPYAPVLDNVASEASITTYEPTWISQPRLTSEKTPDFFEQIGSVFSSLSSLLGISN